MWRPKMNMSHGTLLCVEMRAKSFSWRHFLSALTLKNLNSCMNWCSYEKGDHICSWHVTERKQACYLTCDRSFPLDCFRQCEAFQKNFKQHGYTSQSNVKPKPAKDPGKAENYRRDRMSPHENFNPRFYFNFYIDKLQPYNSKLSVELPFLSFWIIFLCEGVEPTFLQIHFWGVSDFSVNPQSNAYPLVLKYDRWTTCM